MKVLLRSDYAWHEAEWNLINHGFSLKGETNTINETCIISVKDDDRDKYVTCSNCGKTIRNTPSAIKKHQQEHATYKTCLSCHYCRINNLQELDKKYKENDDGTFNISLKQNAKLCCGYAWRNYEINSEQARNSCRYKGCATAKMETEKDIFSKYPGIFDDILTVDVLAKNKWALNYRYGNGSMDFKIPNNLNLYAEVSSCGFVDKFYYTRRNTRYDFMYSPKYAKIIWIKYGKYKESPSGDIPDSIIEKITKKVTELYKEADKK